MGLDLIFMGLMVGVTAVSVGYTIYSGMEQADMAKSAAEQNARMVQEQARLNAEYELEMAKMSQQFARNQAERELQIATMENNLLKQQQAFEEEALQYQIEMQKLITTDLQVQAVAQVERTLDSRKEKREAQERILSTLKLNVTSKGVETDDGTALMLVLDAKKQQNLEMIDFTEGYVDDVETTYKDMRTNKNNIYALQKSIENTILSSNLQQESNLYQANLNQSAILEQSRMNAKSSTMTADNIVKSGNLSAKSIQMEGDYRVSAINANTTSNALQQSANLANTLYKSWNVLSGGGANTGRHKPGDRVWIDNKYGMATIIK